MSWTLCVAAGCGEQGGTDPAHDDRASSDGGAGVDASSVANSDGGGSNAWRPDDAAASTAPDGAQPADPDQDADPGPALDGGAQPGLDAASASEAGLDGAQTGDAQTGDAQTGDAQTGDAQTGSSSTPAQLPTKSGTCPEFANGDASFSPAGVGSRKARLWVGASGGGPFVLYWHSTGAQPSEAETTGLKGVLAQITAAGGVVAAPYTGPNDGTFPWIQTTSESLKLADELVACAIEKKNIDPRRIHVIGFSAGGLMTSTMSLQRSSYVASVVPYSGGLQGSASFEDASNKFAALIFYGGSSDTFVISFQSTSTSYSAALRSNGNYTALCNHGGGHAIPSAGPAAAWRFFQDHPFGTNPSPYVASGLPASLPSYCQAQP